MHWFDVDKAGLSKLLEKRGKAFAIFELIQNGWDTDATRVDVEIRPVEGRPLATIRVEDDNPAGFTTLAHAFTLFAESEKKNDPTKRGRFNLGEKLVLALCDEASIASTTGTVTFDGMGRHESRKKRERGSVFEGRMRMTRDELRDVQAALRQLIPPIPTRVNGDELPSRSRITSFDATLPTDVADAEGVLRRSQRITEVTVHEVLPGEQPMLYELGIPVVELAGGERWHVNVQQKVPLNFDRDNVTPAYLQTIRVLLANAMRSHLTKADATEVWLNAATEDDRIEPVVVAKMLDERFGKKRAIFDPSDPEANKQLMNEGYTVISGGSLSKGQWDQVRGAGLAAPAGKVRPSAFQYGSGRDERVIEPEDYTEGQKVIVELTIDLAWKLIHKAIDVKLVNEPIAIPHAAMFGHHTLTFNVGRLGKAWFEQKPHASHVELILHELAHDKVHDHLTRDFSDEVGRLAVKLLNLSLREPQWLSEHGYEVSR